jgi:hypothetical protein
LRLLDSIKELGPEATELVRELDSVIGERLADCQDAGIAEGMGGVIVDGTIVLDSGVRG